MNHQIRMPNNGTLILLTAEAKEIGDNIIVKSLHQQQPANLPSIDKTGLLDVPAFKAEVISQIEKQLSAKKVLMENYR